MRWSFCKQGVCARARPRSSLRRAPAGRHSPLPSPPRAQRPRACPPPAVRAPAHAPPPLSSCVGPTRPPPAVRARAPRVRPRASLRPPASAVPCLAHGGRARVRPWPSVCPPARRRRSGSTASGAPARAWAPCVRPRVSAPGRPCAVPAGRGPLARPPRKAGGASACVRPHAARREAQRRLVGEVSGCAGVPRAHSLLRPRPAVALALRPRPSAAARCVAPPPHHRGPPRRRPEGDAHQGGDLPGCGPRQWQKLVAGGGGCRSGAQFLPSSCLNRNAYLVPAWRYVPIGVLVLASFGGNGPA